MRGSTGAPVRALALGGLMPTSNEFRLVNSAAASMRPRRAARRPGWAVMALAGLAAGPALAADLPAEPVAVDYVRVCGAAGEGYYYVPGTETCIRMAGEVKLDYFVNSSSGDRTGHWRDDDTSDFRVEGRILAYSFTDTDFGALTTMMELYWTKDVDDNYTPTVDHAFIQWGGFTFGRTESFHDAANYVTWAEIYTPAMSDTKINLAAYTATLADGLSATVSIEDSTERRLGIALYAPPGSAASPDIYPDAIGLDGGGYGGSKWPDAVVRVMTEGAWGSAQVSGALHQVYAAYNGGGVTPSGALAWAASGAFTVNLPHGVTLVGTGTYTRGAPAYAHSSWYDFSDTGALAYDAAFDPGSGDLDLTTAYSLSFGTAFDVGAAQLAIQAGWSRFEDDTVSRVTAGAINADFSQIDVQAQIGFEPVKDLIIGLGTEFQYLDHDDAAIGQNQRMSTYLHVDRVF